MYVSNHTYGNHYIQYEYVTADSSFTQHINVYNPDIEIEQ